MNHVGLPERRTDALKRRRIDQYGRGWAGRAPSGGPGPSGGWRVVEIWESEADSETWFGDNVKPNLPPGIHPDRKYHPLHTAFTK